jgi:23S rRNA pseudouridine2605 synthase
MTRKISQESSGRIRIQKHLSALGMASRREAELWIREGEVMLNGKIAELGDTIDPEVDRLVVRGRSVRPVAPPRVTLLMNKPRGFLCSNEDPHHEKTVFDLLSPVYQKMKLFIAGRLDKDSEGMLILTNDGDLAQKMTHPSAQIPKRYWVRLNKPLPPEMIPLLLRGREVEGEFLKFEKVIPPAARASADTPYEVVLYHGRKREIRRLFESFGYFVKRLQRFQIGHLPLKGLARGQSRKLTAAELRLLLRGDDSPAAARKAVKKGSSTTALSDEDTLY